MTQPISNFSGEYFWLSNFYLKSVIVADVSYRSVEHAYQASKTMNPYERDLFIRSGLTAGQAKRLGRKVTLREDWDKIKVGVMADLLQQKFENPGLRMQLLATSGRELIEGNTWNDTFWGVCEGVGQNYLGRLLMNLRQRFELESLFQ